jgi:prepilin-type N-terminal cleavage/methylation domain-containing protein
MVMRIRSLRTENGFTLTELTVVLALIGVLLAVAFAGMKAVYDGQAVSNRQAWFAREIGAPLQVLEESLTQNIRLEAATPYSVTLLVDRARYVGTELEFDNVERHVINATADGQLTETVYATDALRNNTGVLRTTVWSEHVANQAAGVPLFAFLDDSGASVTATNAPTSSRRVDLRLVAEYDGRAFEGTRTVFFRNR